MNAAVGALVAVLLIASVAAVRHQTKRARRVGAKQERFRREHCWQSVLRVPCAPDNEAGINLADADECALTYSLPEFDPTTDPQWAAGRARLLDAIRDERQKGDQA